MQAFMHDAFYLCPFIRGHFLFANNMFINNYVCIEHMNASHTISNVSN